MADDIDISNDEPSKRKKRSYLQRLLSENSSLDEEPPPKRLKLETDGKVVIGTCDNFVQVESPVKTKDKVTPRNLFGTKPDSFDAVITTPTKLEQDSSLLSPTQLQSPADSAYQSSAADRSPWPFVKPQFSVGNDSGLCTDGSEYGTPAVTDLRTTFEIPIHGEEQGETDIITNFLHRNFSMLKDEMLPMGLADQLFAFGVIDDRSVENIREVKLRAHKCDLLIKAIARCPDIKKPYIKNKMRKAFEEESCLELLDDLEKDHPPLVPISDKPSFKKFEIQSILHRLEKEIEDRIEPKHIIDDLVTFGMLNLDEHDDILNTTLKANRVQCLLAYVMREPETHFPKFCRAVEKTYPDLGRKLVQADHHTVQKQPEVKIKANVTLDSSIWNPRNNGKHKGLTYVKFNLQDEKELEKMVVDDCNRNSPTGLEEEAMEVGFAEISIKYSSIKIYLKQLSPLAQLRFYKKCMNSPQFLEGWLQSLLSQERLKEMETRGVTAVQLEISIQKPTTVECLCQLTKKDIVTHYTYIEKSLKDVDHILQVFATYSNFPEQTRQIFQEIRTKEVGRVETFLRKVLEMEDIAVCLLQRELINTNQGDLLDAILKKKSNGDEKTYQVRVNTFRKCFTFLLDEIEPRKYIATLDKIPNSEEVLEYVMSKESRRLRCRKFLDFIHKEGKAALDHFILALKKENNMFILDTLVSADSKFNHNEKDVERLRDSIIEKVSEITEEVDTHVLRPIFLERKVIKAKVFDAVCKHPSFKTRIASLLIHVLQQDASVLKCFMHAMETRGYERLVSEINKEKEKFKPCPRLDMGTEDVIVFRGTCNLTYTTEKEKESPLQVELHKRIYGKPDKDSYLRHWLAQVNEEPLSRKRRNSCTDVEEDFNIPPKRMFIDADSGSSINGSLCRRNDEAYDLYSQGHEERLSGLSGSSSLPTSPSTMIGLYEAISPPTSPKSEHSAFNSFVPDKDYKTFLTIKERDGSK